MGTRERVRLPGSGLLGSPAVSSHLLTSRGSRMAVVLELGKKSMSRDMTGVRNRPSEVRASKDALKDQSAERRPNQWVGSFTNMSEQDRHELADVLEAELARL